MPPYFYFFSFSNEPVKLLFTAVWLSINCYLRPLNHSILHEFKERSASTIDLQAIVEAIPGKHLILLPDSPTFTIVGVTDSFLQTAM